jgi:hypothetical protein
VLCLHVRGDHLHLLAFTAHTEQVIAPPYQMDSVGNEATGAGWRHLVSFLAFFEVELASKSELRVILDPLLISKTMTSSAN